MAQRYRLLALLVLAAVFASSAARAQTEDERYTIMRPELGSKPAKPEPWLAPKYQSPPGTRQHVVIPRSVPVPQPQKQVPPELYVPQTGRVLPNLPAAGGRETSQDRALRCAHQAGVYGAAAGDRNAYIGSCINQ